MNNYYYITISICSKHLQLLKKTSRSFPLRCNKKSTFIKIALKRNIKKDCYIVDNFISKPYK